MNTEEKAPSGCLVLVGIVGIIGVAAAALQTIVEGGEWNWPMTILVVVIGGAYTALRGVRKAP